MTFDMNKILQENAQKSMKESATGIYMLFRSLCDAGFTEQQAMEIVISMIGKVNKEVQQ